MAKEAHRPLFALIVDDEKGVCATMAMVLQRLGVETEIFHTAKPAIASLDRRHPQLIFLDIALKDSDAIDVIKGLREKHYKGVVQLMSGGRPLLLEGVHRMGVRYGMTMREPLRKPFRGEAIRQVIAETGAACGG
jgi:DNA-binding NtrC family response regulator